MNRSQFIVGQSQNMVFGQSPPLNTTYARWSAAESTNGGLDASGNWLTVDGTKTLIRIGSYPTYNASSFNGRPGISSTSNGSWYINNVSLLNNSAAAILLFTTDDSLSVMYEFGPDTNSTKDGFASYVERNQVESVYNSGTGLRLRQVQQSALTKPYLVATQFYTNPTDVIMATNGIAAISYGGYDAVGTSTSFGTKQMSIFSRNVGQYQTNGIISAYHLFHTAPNSIEWTNWINYYKSMYNIIY